VALHVLALLAGAGQVAVGDGCAWLAGDHHVHTEHSVEWDKHVDPPAPILRGDARYPIETQARMAHRFGLDWIVIADHGGPNHSAYARTVAWPALRKAREAVPDILQFDGIELDVPAAKHATVIMPHGPEEAVELEEFERRAARKNTFPEDASRDTEAFMLKALDYAAHMTHPPLIIVNHPGRSAPALGSYGLVSPRELRNWQDAAPDIVIGMEGAPGHQAMALNAGSDPGRERWRGDYDRFPTMGGFDQMTARIGGVWDSMLGEGRRWWVTASSDSHLHVTDDGGDFWPGEYSKTYTYARKDYADVFDALRNGRVFVATGDLISQLYLSLSVDGGLDTAAMGGTLHVRRDAKVRVTVRFLDSKTTNAHGDDPTVRRVDLIVGDIGPQASVGGDSNPTARVARRFGDRDWRKDGPYTTFSWMLGPVDRSGYVRLRGTSTNEQEPAMDMLHDDPWQDLWFYSNPVFIQIRN
jgi:hypothetical protein